MHLNSINSDFATDIEYKPNIAYPLIRKAIVKIDRGELPPQYTKDLQVFKQVLVDIAEQPKNNAKLAPLKSEFAAALECSPWFDNTELNEINRGEPGQNLILAEAAEIELRRNLERLLRNGLPGLFRGIDGNIYHNYSHCQHMAQRTLKYSNELGIRLSMSEMLALSVGLVGHDGAHSGVLGPGDLEHNVQYAVKCLYLFMDYYGFSKQQIGFAIEKGVFPTVSFNSEFVPQDAIGVAAELGDLAFEIELPHFLINSLHVFQEQIPTIIPPPDTIPQWLRAPIRDGFIGTYLMGRVAELEKIPTTKPNTFIRLRKWMSDIQTEISELASYEDNNLLLPEKFQFFAPIKERALATIRDQKNNISPKTMSARSVRAPGMLPT